MTTPARWLDERDLNDGPVCITRRIIYRDKPSRAYINGRPATVQMLKELGIQLVDIHGQHEHQSLMRRETQRSVLDEYAGIQAKVQQLSALYDRLQSLRTSHNDLSEAAEDRTARTDMLRYQIDELVALDTTETEFQELEVEQRRLAHASDLIEGMHFVTQMLHEAEDSSTVSFLARCIQRLDALAGFAPEIEEIRSLLDVALVQVEEAGIQLNQQLDKVELDPQRLTVDGTAYPVAAGPGSQASLRSSSPAGEIAGTASGVGRHRKYRIQSGRA